MLITARRYPRSKGLNLFTCLLVVFLGTIGVTPAAVSAATLEIPFISQYNGQSTQNTDCGSASVAMVVEYFGKRPSNISDSEFVSQIRVATGNTNPLLDLNFSQLEQAINSYGLTYSEIASGCP